MNPIRNPFSRDECPALTDAIRGVVNGQPLEVEEAVTPAEGKKPSNPFNPTLGDLLKSKQQDKKADAKTKGVKEEVTPKRMEVLNRAVKTGMAGGLRNAQSRALADRASLAITRAYATKGGKKVTGFDKAKREHEAAKARHKTLKSTPAGFNEDIQTESWTSRNTRKRTPEQRKRADEAGAKWIAAHPELEWRKNNSRRGGGWYRKDAPPIKESQELDERIIDEVDAFQAAKNWVKGKGFKTNREVSYAKVQKNYDAMKKREAAEAKKRG